MFRCSLSRSEVRNGLPAELEGVRLQIGCGGPQPPKSTRLTFEVNVVSVPIWSKRPSPDVNSGN
jgi:hypothetical protein